MLSGQCQDAQIDTIGIYSTQGFGGNVIKFMQCLKAKLLYGSQHLANAEKSIRRSWSLLRVAVQLACLEYENIKHFHSVSNIKAVAARPSRSQALSDGTNI